MDIINETKEYYGKVLNKSTDLKTNACCTIEKYPKYIKDILKDIHDDILSSYYGCGLVIPDCLEGKKILDIGCGTGRDVYLLSKLVGENGSVTGLDMTKEQLDIAFKYQEYHKEKYNYKKSNVNFVNGYMEELDTLNLDLGSYDVIISNCVINLSPNKEKVIKNIFNLLKDGGEFYFSDVYSTQRVPENLKQNNILWGECLSGALYWNDFINLCKKCDFKDPRLVKSKSITVNNENIIELLGNIEFYSGTYRLFKMPNLLEPDCEDYGQAVIYKGTITNSKDYWDLDGHHRMVKNKVFLVCGNTWNMLYHTRFKEHFTFIGDFNTHYGIFEGCGKNIPFKNLDSVNNSNNCC
jgi:arsenite methyltransferase